MTMRRALVIDRGMPTVRALARWSKECRVLLDLSQMQVGDQAGLSQGAISRFESGTCIATPLVTVLMLMHFYRQLAATTGITLPDASLILDDPQTWPIPALDDTRMALLHAWDTAPPWQQRLVWACMRSVFEYLGELRSAPRLPRGTHATE